MYLTRVMLAVGFGMFCSTWVPAFAQSSATLSLTPVAGTADIYADASGKRFIVKPEDSSAMCDNAGCMVKVCRHGGEAPCVWFHCTTTDCTKLQLP